ncbi:MAG: cell division protein FtsA [Marinicaulis sp.]|nr:cell division protein FtsA [Marinicaulis sp.]NNE39862.1 cell division protein FtsA [Marinicaulis sp.]NNL88302.1 cell division protein FtsA [Marinicaulis sp.]
MKLLRSANSHRIRKNNEIIAAIDIGDSKISCFVAKVITDGDAPLEAEVIGVGHYRAPTRQGGRISAHEMEMSLRNAVESAERMAQMRIQNVHVAIPGKYLRTRRIGVDIETAGGLITQEDVDDCIAEGAKIAAADGNVALHAIPTMFQIDGEDAFAEPVGLSGGILSVEMLGVAARQSTLDNLSALIERAGLTVQEFVAAPLASAEAVLISDEKDLGVVLIDIGSGSTDFAVYDAGVMIDCGAVRVGAGHITKDIAQIFGAPLAQAERTKNLHGAALIGPGDEHRLIEFTQLGVVGEKVRASRADLCEVIIPRMEEILELIGDQLPDDNLTRSGLRRAVITGAGSLLVGAREITERTLAMKTRIGRPMSLAGAPEAACSPGFSVCSGVIHHSINSDTEPNSSLGVSGQSLQEFPQAAFLGGVEAWFRAKF